MVSTNVLLVFLTTFTAQLLWPKRLTSLGKHPGSFVPLTPSMSSNEHDQTLRLLFRIKYIVPS